MLHYDTEWCKIYYIEDIPCVHLDWLGFAKPTEFREACDTALNLLEKTLVSKMLVDNSKAKIISPENQKWFTEDWMARAYEKGYRTSAIIVSSNIFNEVSVNRIVDQLDDHKFTIKYFDQQEKARKWLKEL